MKIAIYSPYLDTAGGGEKYTLTIASILGRNNKVYILLDSHLSRIGVENIKEKIIKLHNIDLSNVHFIDAPLGKGSSFFKRLLFLKTFDILFYLTDGSIFYSTAKKNILHIQSPLIGQPAKSWWGRLKLKSWNLIIYNSKFTQTNSQKNWPLISQVIYPPVDVDKIKPLKKKNYILSVGRFSGYLKDKKQEVLIKVFKDLYENGHNNSFSSQIKDWSLHLAGSAGEGDENYIESLKQLAKGLPIKFYPNLDYDGLVNLYGQSSIYWHASGFEEADPTKMEHFGIVTVEAMAAGCVPVVINKGGQPEIIEEAKSGFLWNDLNELKSFTLKVVLDENLREDFGRKALKRSKLFSKNIFEEKILKLLR